MLQSILSVDGDAVVRSVRNEVLRTAGFAIVEAASGTDALKLALETQPILVILAVELPGADGFSICKRLKAGPRTASIPVLHVSGRGRSQGDYPESLESGGDAWLQEPVEPPVLLAVARVLIRGCESGRRTEEALRKSERRLRDAQRVGHSGYLDWDVRTNEIEWSDETYRIYGFEPGAFTPTLESTVWLVPAEDREYVERQLNLALSGNSNYDIEHRMVRPDGQVIYVHARGEVTRDADGKPLRMLGTVVDITEHKRAEQALRESEEKYRSLFHNSLDGILLASPDGRVIAANSAACRILDRTEEEIILAGRDGIGDVSDPSFQAAMAERDRTGRFRGELVFKSRDGRKFPVELSSVVYGERAGETRASIFFRDITDRKQTEEALRASEAFYRGITDLIPSRIAYVDREQRFQFVNGRYEEWFKCKREAIVGKHVIEVLGPPLYERARPYIEAALSGKEVRYELEVGDGAPQHLNIVYVPHFGKHGEIPGFFASIEDCTEQKRLEGQLRQSQKMEAVGLLAGGIAHDFNNLLTVINGYSALALQQLGPENPVSVIIDEVAGAGARAASLTQQLLAFSRKQMLQPKVLDLNVSLTGLETMLRRLLEERIELQIVLDASRTCVKADPAQVEQMVMNLVVNARDAMPQGGRLTIEIRNVRLNANDCGGQPGLQPGDYVMLAVTDTGHGMDAQTQARIFEPFFTTKAVGKGTGLGLSTTYGIVQQSAGHITVESERGRGTTFRIYLPRVGDVAEPVQPAGAASAARAGTGTVLLVEDEPALRRMVHQALLRGGYTVMEAANGEAALQVSEQHEGDIQLLLTDIVMPCLGGPELAERLMQRRPGIKVLYISGYAETVVADQGPPRVEAAFLQKPFATADLLQKVGELLGRPSQPAK